MCEACNYWHGQYNLDILGRSVQKIQYDIESRMKVIEIRAGYTASGEGYSIRTRELQRELELDRQTLRKVQENIREHESGKTSDRRPRGGESPIKNGRGNRGSK